MPQEEAAQGFGSSWRGKGDSEGYGAAPKWIFLDFFPQDIDTAIVSDTTDDLWFLNECPLEQGSAGLKVEVLDCEEVTEGDTKVPRLGLV